MLLCRHEVTEQESHFHGGPEVFAIDGLLTQNVQSVSVVHISPLDQLMGQSGQLLLAFFPLEGGLVLF